MGFICIVKNAHLIKAFGISQLPKFEFTDERG
jgi:hypothetical protein